MAYAVGSDYRHRQTCASHSDWTFLLDIFYLFLYKWIKIEAKKWQITKNTDVTGQAMTFLFNEQSQKLNLTIVWFLLVFTMMIQLYCHKQGSCFSRCGL